MFGTIANGTLLGPQIYLKAAKIKSRYFEVPLEYLP